MAESADNSVEYPGCKMGVVRNGSGACNTDDGDNVSDVQDDFVPLETKKKKVNGFQPLKRKATGPKSAVRARKLNNMSLNNSIVKQTLRANNRSLARALEMARQEYSVLQQQHVELKAKAIDSQRRITKRLTDLHSLLDTVGLKLTNSLSLLEEAQGLCAVDQDLNVTTITPDCSTLQPASLSPPRIVVATPKTPVLATALGSPVTKTDDEAFKHPAGEECLQTTTEDSDVTSDIIERMRADITHTVSSIQGWKAAPVSLPPLDVSIIMEQSYLMDQLPNFDEQPSSSKEGTTKCRGQSRSRSGRRTAMVYKAGSLDSDDGDEQAEEKGPRRSLRPRSRSRHGSSKIRTDDLHEDVHLTIKPKLDSATDSANADDAPTEPTHDVSGPVSDAHGCFSGNELPRTPTMPSPEGQAGGSFDYVAVPFGSPIETQTSKSQQDETQETIFRPCKEIPRTPPIRRVSAVELDLPTEQEVQISSNGHKCKPNKYSPVECKNTKTTTTQDKKDKKRAKTKAVKSAVRKNHLPDDRCPQEIATASEVNDKEEETIGEHVQKVPFDELTHNQEYDAKHSHSQEKKDKKKAKAVKSTVEKNHLPGDSSPHEIATAAEVNNEEVATITEHVQKVPFEEFISNQESDAKHSHSQRDSFNLPKGICSEASNEDSPAKDSVDDNKGKPTEDSVPISVQQHKRTTTTQDMKDKKMAKAKVLKSTVEKNHLPGGSIPQEIPTSTEVNNEDIATVTEDDQKVPIEESTSNQESHSQRGSFSLPKSTCTEASNEHLSVKDSVNNAKPITEECEPIPAQQHKKTTTTQGKKDKKKAKAKAVKNTVEKNHLPRDSSQKIPKVSEVTHEEKATIMERVEKVPVEESTSNQKSDAKRSHSRRGTYAEVSSEDSPAKEDLFDKEKNPSKEFAPIPVRQHRGSTTTQGKKDNEKAKAKILKSTVEKNHLSDSSPLEIPTACEVNREDEAITTDHVQKVPIEEHTSDQESHVKHSRLRRGTCTEASNEDPLAKEVFGKGKIPTEECAMVPVRQRRGTFCVHISEPRVLVVSEDEYTSNDTFDSRQKQSGPCQNRGTHSVDTATIDAVVYSDDDKTLVADHDMDDLEDNRGNISSPQFNDSVNATMYGDQDMELTEVYNIPLNVPLCVDDISDKAPVPAFIRKSQGQMIVDEPTEEPSKEKKSSKKILIQKLRKNERKYTHSESNETSSEASGIEDLAISTGNKSELSKDVNKPYQKSSSGDSFKKPDMKLVRPVSKAKPKGFKEPKPADDSSDSDKDVCKYQALVEKPGKIVFKAGRKTIDDLKSKEPKNGKSQSKVKSLLSRLDKPRSKTARSKTRMPDTIHGFDKNTNANLKTVFDMSLNESITVLPQMSYGDFREHNPQIEAMKTALKNAGSTIDSSPHGIMLVMGNGKRTKPRRRTKSVTYSNKFDVHLRTPSFSGESNLPSCSNVREFAGATPPRRSKSAPKESKSSEEEPRAAAEEPKTAPKETKPDVVDEDSCPNTPDLQFFKSQTKKLDQNPRDVSDMSLHKLDAVNSMKESTSIQTVTRETKNIKSKKVQSQVRAPPSTEETKTQPVAVPVSPTNSVTKEHLRCSTSKECPKSSMDKENPWSSRTRVPAKKGTGEKMAAKRSLVLHEELNRSADIVPKRQRRAASTVSYKEPTLNSKLRRDDPSSSSLSKEGEHRKSSSRQKSDKRSRPVLQTLTNLPQDA